MIDSLLAFLRPAPEEAGEWDEVTALVRRTVEGGSGARRQREAFARSGRMEDVVDLITEETRRGIGWALVKQSITDY
jgi:carboxylate-amine ligase